MTTLERAAMALFYSQRTLKARRTDRWSLATEGQKDLYRADVRAILLSIRNEAMVKAGGGDDPYSYGHTAAERWTAAIDSILKETP